MSICQDKYHEDIYENGEIEPLRKEDMIGSICYVCHDERQEAQEECAANGLDMQETGWDF